MKIDKGLCTEIESHQKQGHVLAAVVIHMHQGSKWNEKLIKAQVTVLKKCTKLKIPVYFMGLVSFDEDLLDPPEAVSPAPDLSKAVGGKPQLLGNMSNNVFNRSDLKQKLQANLNGKSPVNTLIIMGSELNSCVLRSIVTVNDNMGPGALEQGYVVMTCPEILSGKHSNSSRQQLEDSTNMQIKWYSRLEK